MKGKQNNIKLEIINKKIDFRNIKENDFNGITLIALVITIIVLLIIAGVSIAILTGENGIITQAKRAKEETERAAKEEAEALKDIEDFMLANGKYSSEKGVNTPNIVTGMKKIMFTLPEGNSKGTIIKQGEQGFDDKNWYNYQESKWANAQTEDGSMWVWIPRYAYKITYKNPNNKSEGGTIDVKFLIGTSDEYYDENGEKKIAKRATSATEEVDTTTDYYVHPAFTNESNIKFANGGWDKELPGIWVAKFEAGYASGNNNAPVKASSVAYTAKISYIPGKEEGSLSESEGLARNWLDGTYGETKTTIKYPTFQPKTYSMNYINTNDAYNISKALTENGNIYGLSSSTDSHLMKNSEWGAVAYLSYSRYGTNGSIPYINNISLNNTTENVYAVTGVTTGATNAEELNTTIEKINGTTENTANDGIFTWDQIEGQKSSTTLNMYGVYDLIGGLWEVTTGYIANGNENLKNNGASVTYDRNKLKTESTKYTTVYPHGNETEDLYESSEINYNANKYIFGDGIRETSTDDIGITSWNSNFSYFLALNEPFTYYGGSYWNSKGAGLFGFSRRHGTNYCYSGFRTVLAS